MKSNIFIPKTINVGFQNRSDTYTKKLAYVIYYDEKGKLRKETSWNSWRSKDIEPQEFDNIPTSGFVLNKKVGDYVSDWNHRQAYVRVYDPRDFEFEITIENLLYILENANSIKGKGLEGEFTYGWDGKDLILIPTESPDYKSISEYNNIVHNNETVKAKDLVIGATYMTKQNKELIYVGKFDYWKSEYISYDSYDKKWINKKKRYWFYNGSYFETFTSIKDKFISIIDNECIKEYADIFDKLEHHSGFSPIDESKTRIIEQTFEEFSNSIKHRYWFRGKNGANYGIHFIPYKNKYETEIEYKNRRESMESYDFDGLKDFFNKIKPVYVDKYLQNGNFYERRF